LNRQISKVWALEVEGLRTYPGNYDEYKRQRAEELEQLRARAERVERRRAELEAFIERFGAKATKARQAQSRAKMLEKLGQVELGHQVSLGYYAQHQGETLDRSSTVLDELRRTAPSLGDPQLRGVLGAFLFSGEDVDKRVGVLSGGERARVALAKLLLRPAN